MSAMASEITGASIVWLAVCSGADQRKHPRSASLALVRGNPPLDDVIMWLGQLTVCSHDSSDYQRMKSQSSTFMVLWEGNTRVNRGFPLQRASKMESASMSWRHHGMENLGISHVVISFPSVLSCAIAIYIPTMVRCISAIYDGFENGYHSYTT